MAKSTPRILITGAGGSIAINVTRSLKMASEKLELYGCDASSYFIHLAETSEKRVLAPATRSDEYLAGIQSCVKDWKIDLIVPSNLTEILVLARSKDRIGAKVFLPSLESIEIGADKWKTYEKLRDRQLPVPRTSLISKPGDIEEAFWQFGSPVWFRGSGVPGRGVGVASLPARNPKEAHGWVDFHDAWGQMTAAEFLPGDNLTWMGLWKDGNLIASQSRKRLAYVISHVSPSGVTGAPSISLTIHDPRLNDVGSRAMKAMDHGYSGVGFVDFKCDGKGEPKITEVNVGRFGTTHHFYTVAGANFPYWLVQLAMGEAPKVPGPYDVVAEGLYWIRTLDANQALVTERELHRFDR